MDIVYVRSGSSRRQGLAKKPPARNELQGDEGEGHTSAVQVKREWDVTITVNDNEAVRTTVTDPFFESEYRSIFEHYLRDSDRPRWSAESMSMTLQEHDAGAISRLEERIGDYGEELLRQLRLEPSCLSQGVTECQIYVIETPERDVSGPGIHCLAWELLEAVHVDCMPKLRLRITRVSDVPPPLRSLRTLRPGYRPAPSFAAVQADPALDFRILLVVARDFSRTGAERDPEPDLAQWPLMTVQRKLRSRMMLEVVRPGSREKLEEHLEVRAAQGVYFHLVHFDLHGHVMNDEHGNQVPWLLFAKQHHIHQSHGYQVPQTHLAKAEAVAQVLGRYQIQNVVLNACLSAYNRAGSGTSLTYIFLEHGICNVSAMWFYVHWQTVSTYLNAFYDELLVQGKDFHLASHRGRDAIRQKPTNRVGRAYRDFFLCVNYTRTLPTKQLPSPVAREPSPAPSARSQGSTTSNNSSKSFMSGVWKPSTPRLSDSLFMGDEPVMRMQLHLLELEYKLLTFRIVYASDLRHPGSKLNDTIDQMVHMWLNTNLVDEVLYYKGKDFARSQFFSHGIKPRKQKTRNTNGGYLQLLFPKPVRALRQTLHIVQDVDNVIAPGYLVDEARNLELERRRYLVQDGLQRFADRLHDHGHSYLLFLGSEDAQWWRTYLHYLQGEWWVNSPWSYTVHSRYIRDVRLPNEEKKPKLGVQG